MRQNTITKLAGLVVLFAGLMVALSGCQMDPAPVGPPRGYDSTTFGGPASADGSATNRVDGGIPFSVGDTIKVEFSDPELEKVETEIKHDGMISLVLVDQVKVAGKSARQVEQEIKGLYVPKYYKRLTVTVTSGTKFFYVGGEVKLENRFPYSGRITVLKAIQTAGGFSNFASKRDVKVIRANGQVIEVDCVKALKDPSLDIEIFPNDQINVRQSPI